MNQGGRERNALNVLHGRDRRGRRGEAADKEQGDGEKRRRQGAGEGEAEKQGGRGWAYRAGGGGVGRRVHGAPCQRSGKEPGSEQRQRQSEEERAGSPSQGPAGLASKAQQNENLLTTQNC